MWSDRKQGHAELLGAYAVRLGGSTIFVSVQFAALSIQSLFPVEIRRDALKATVSRTGPVSLKLLKLLTIQIAERCYDC